MLSKIVEFVLSGMPQTKGSWVALAGGKMKRDNPNELGWARAIGWAAKVKLRGAPPSASRVRVDVEFRLPPSHGKRNQRDLDKLLRSALDAMQKLVYLDDEQVDMIVAEKIVTQLDHGASITVREHAPRSCTTLDGDELGIVRLALSRMISDYEGPEDVSSAQRLLERLQR